MKQKKWTRPQLVILVRGNPENAVLATCKSNVGTVGPSGEGGADPVDGSYQGCRSKNITITNTYCSGYNCRMKTEGFSGGQDACPGGGYGEYMFSPDPLHDSPCEVLLDNLCHNKSDGLIGNCGPLPLVCSCGCCLVINNS